MGRLGRLALAAAVGCAAFTATVPGIPATAVVPGSAPAANAVVLSAPHRDNSNPRLWRVLVPKPAKGGRALTLIEGAATSVITFNKERLVTDWIRVRTGPAYVRRAVSVERRRIDTGGSWMVADRGLTSKRGSFNADLVPGGLGTWQFRFTAVREPGAKQARTYGETLTFVSSHTATETVWDQISAGGAHTCALATTGKPYCWGYGGFGALGNGGLGLVTIPAAVTTGGVLADVTLKQISAGNAHTCALDTNGRAYCWGDGSAGQLGDGKATDSVVPVRVDTSGVLKTVELTSLSTGGNRSCGVGANGRIYCWGDGSTGALGNGQLTNAQSPVAVDLPATPRPLVSVTTAGGHTCGLRDNGVAHCWGSGVDGQLGNGLFLRQLQPDRVELAVPIKSISAGGSSTCAVTVGGEGYCWGRAENGRLGANQTTPTATPAQIDGSWMTGAPLSQMTSGDGSSCAITTGAQVGCWGTNRNGQLGLGHTSDSGIPVWINGLTNVRELSLGYRHSCAVTNEGKAYCWGNDANGELGNANWPTSFTPFQVSQPLS